MAHSWDACSSFLLCSCPHGRHAHKAGTGNLANDKPVSSRTRCACTRELCDNGVRLTNPDAQGLVGASCCSTRDFTCLLFTPTMRKNIHSSIALLMSRVRCTRLTNDRSLAHSEIEATVRPSRQLELEASLGIGSRSALLIGSRRPAVDLS